ncbi:MAG: PEP-CTERM sorting domain-containing protein [Hyphomicrobiales bacterium]|nr:PEP-CTERM sorting domain-containing protein [Hyphomicrobiales bacterium]
MIATLGASSATHAAAINFNFSALDGSILHDGTSLSDSTHLDFSPLVIQLVTSLGPGDDSGLNEFDTITLAGATAPTLNNAIVYGTTPGPLGTDVILSWPMVVGPGVDTFTETLTTVQSIATMSNVPNFIGVTLAGTLTDTMHLFTDAPVLLSLSATQVGANIPSVSFSDTSIVTPTIPEPSTWTMMAFGFAALGYAAARQRKVNVTVLSR